MDTFIGNFSLTDNQVLNLPTLNVPPFKGCSYRETGELVAVSDSAPTAQQITAMSTAINNLPKVIDKSIARQLFNSNKSKVDIYQAFKSNPTGQALLAQWSGLVGQMIDFKDFEDISVWANSSIPEPDLTIFKNCFKLQSVDLDNL